MNRFSYIKRLYIHYNYVDSNIEIDLESEEKNSYKHLILTGKNGSGKTQVLQSLNREIYNIKAGIPEPQYHYNKEANDFPSFKIPKAELDFHTDYDTASQCTNFTYAFLACNRTFEAVKLNDEVEKIDFKKLRSKQDAYKTKISSNAASIKAKLTNIRNNERTIEKYQNEIASLKKKNKDIEIRSDIIANQKAISTKEALIEQQEGYIENSLNKIAELRSDNQSLVPNISFADYFINFLLYKKKEQAYAYADGETEKLNKLNEWFKTLNNSFKYIFENDKIELKHNLKDSIFYFELEDGRTIEFNHLSHGYNSILKIVAEIWLQEEAYKETNTGTAHPRGIVVIDEIENHLHMSLQEKIMPFLIQLFPNIQFILATHSPVIIASLSNAVIFDLSSKNTVKEDITGIPYNVLMKSHFGLPTEYSLSASEKLEKAKKLILKEEKTEKDVSEMMDLAKELNELSPDLSLDLELALERINK